MVSNPEDFETEIALVNDIAGFRYDPLGYIRYAFPWGNGELASAVGPRDWQADTADQIGQALRDPARRHHPIRLATASGHGPGKSSFVGMILSWAMSTCDDCRVLVTANTDTQLRTKTWPEVEKWQRMAINSHWFKTTATSVASLDSEHTMTWRADAVPWSESNTEAFAGLHNKGKRVVVIFDEASNIADKVWEVAEGAMTDEDTEIIWLAFGNPTRNTGRFRQCFTKFKHRWITRQIDSRTVEGTNKVQFAQWAADYGEDSDFFRVRVRGVFPRASSLQLIPGDIVTAARKREPKSFVNDPLIMGIDIARGGEDNNVFAFRRGMDARTVPWRTLPGSESRDSNKTISLALPLMDEFQPDAVFVDSTGVGGPVADQLRRLRPEIMIVDVNFASQAPDPKCANMRSYMWREMRDGLKNGLAIPDDEGLDQELTAVEYGHNQVDKLLLEKKDAIKKRLGISPDMADALALTYSMPVTRLDMELSARGAAAKEYDPLEGW